MCGVYDSPLHPTSMINCFTTGPRQVPEGADHPRQTLDPQGQSSHKERNLEKDRRDKVCSDVVTQKVGPCPALGNRSRRDEGHQPCLNPNPPSLLLWGLAVPELKLEWVKSSFQPLITRS